MPFGAQWESFTIKTPFTSQKSDWKQMVKCAANKRAISYIKPQGYNIRSNFYEGISAEK